MAGWLLSLSILYSFVFVKSLPPSGTNVCYDKVLQQHYCCAEHEEQNGTCIACKTGYSSHKGLPCSACRKNRYGERCMNKCKCIKHERCDNIVGCIDFADKIQEDKHENTSSTNNTQGISKLNLLTYVATITACVALFGVFLVGYAFRGRGLGNSFSNRRSVLTFAQSNMFPSDIIAIVDEHPEGQNNSIATISDSNVDLNSGNIRGRRVVSDVQSSAGNGIRLSETYYTFIGERNTRENEEREIYLNPYNSLEQSARYLTLNPKRSYEHLIKKETFEIATAIKE